MALPGAYGYTAGALASLGNVTVTSSTIPTNGLYLPAANTVGVATNGTLVGSFSTTTFLTPLLGRFGLNTITADTDFDDLVVQVGAAGGLSLLGVSASNITLGFGISGATGAAIVRYNHTALTMTIGPQVTSSILRLQGSGVTNLTLSGGSGSELTAATGSVSIAKFLRLPTAGELTIAAGVVTATGSFHTIDTQSDDPTDDLDTISGGTAGDVLTISASNAARTVVAKDGTGNLVLAGDFTMDNTEDALTLRYNGTSWVELSRSDNGA